MKILAVEKAMPGISDEMFTSDILRSEAERAWELYRDGIFREMYFTEDHSAVIILEADTPGKALEALDSLPLVSAGLIGFELKTLTPYDGFSRLFKN